MRIPAALAERAHWLATAAALLLFATVFSSLRLEPHVDEDFFFSSDDPAFQQVRRIQELFPSQTLLLLAASAPDIRDPRYRERIEALGDALAALGPVRDLKSLARGPDGVDDALESPLWRRLLVAENGAATYLVAVVEGSRSRELVAGAERLIARHQTPEFQLRMAGVPYVVESIRRNLKRDFIGFSAAAVGVFAVVILALFRSLPVLLGTLLSCGSAVVLTLWIQHLLGIRIGLLTANLTTIVFVLTQSHIVFMTSNWRALAAESNGDGTSATGRAWRRTVAASGWCMLTTLLGFASLLLVQARPLRELGVGGLVGTLAAMLCAYGMYPAYLRRARPPRAAEGDGRWDARFTRPHGRAAVALAVACALCAVGLLRLDTDPSLLEYFEEGTELREAIAYVDRNGGSSPLQLVVRRRDGGRLDTRRAYEDMWALQRGLHEDAAVGTVISLPVLMAEAERAPLSFLFSWENLLDLLERPFFGRVADRFVTEDRSRALFLLRMREAEREKRRTEVLSRLRQVAGDAGFEIDLVGGIYYLQGALADAVGRSLVTGIGALLLLFVPIAWAVSRSLPTAAALVGCLALVPLAILGAAGGLGVPVDVISAPATNVCIGMAVDVMIHLTAAWRRARGDPAARWSRALRRQWRGVLGSAGVVMAGFSIFAFSRFPPSQRFGLEVVFGTAVAAGVALLLLPRVAERLARPGAGNGRGE